MKSLLTVLILILFVTIYSYGAEPREAAQALAESLTRLESHRAASEADLLEIESVLRDAAERGVPLDVPRMLRVVDDAGLPFPVRATSLRVLAELGKQSGEVLHEIARRGRVWVSTATRGPDAHDPEEWSSCVGFISTFWKTLQSYPHAVILGAPEAIEFIADLGGSKECAIEPDVPRQAVALLIALKLPLDTASKYAVSILRSRSDSTSLELAALASLIPPEHRESLRSMVRDTGDGVEAFPWGCAFALAHVGDAWVGEELTRRAARVQVSDQHSLALFERGIAMVRAQSNGNGLLELVRTLPSESQELRRWALNRAIETGTDSQEIRHAVLDFAGSSAATLRSIQNERLRTMRTSTTLFWLKEWGLKNGILRDGDLAEVSPHPGRGFPP